jgi:GT2 family glycosyltransferase
MRLTESRPDLSVCIVNHRTPDLLHACLRSIDETSGGLRVEVLALNNLPDSDGGFAAALADFPHVRRFQNETPRGFASNQNSLLRRATGRYLMPLNSDTIVHSGALHELVWFMDAHRDVGLSGPRLEFDDGRLQPSCRNFPAILPVFLEVTGLWRLFRGNAWFGDRVFLCNPHTGVVDVDWLSGACYIVRRETIDQVGLYDEALFPGMYGEDVEWCWRIRQAGWRIAFVPAAVVTHLDGQSDMPDRLYSIYEGSVKFMNKSLPPARSLLFRAIALFGVLLRLVASPDPTTRSNYGRVMRLLVRGHSTP